MLGASKLCWGMSQDPPRVSRMHLKKMRPHWSSAIAPNPINWDMPYCPNHFSLPFFLHLFFSEVGCQSVLPRPLLSRPFLSLGFLSPYENSHERRRHERRGAERGHYTRSHHKRPAVCHTVSRPPWSPRRTVLTIDLALSRSHCFQRSALRSSLYM